MRKEIFEWVHSWCEHAEKHDLPRVLLVGDSICHGYREKVQQRLQGKAYVDYVALSYAVDSEMYHTLVGAFMADSHYDVLHINHGLHGIHMTAAEYRAGMEKLLQAAQKRSKIILATSTVVYEAENKRLHAVWTAKVGERNAAVRELAEQYGVGVDDLYAASLAVPVSMRHEDGIHYEEDGYELLADAVANSLQSVL